MEYKLDILLSTDIWDPASKGVFFILIIIFIWIIDLLIHNYYSYFFIKSRVRKLKKYMDETKNTEEIESLINEKHSGNYKYYILEKILPDRLKKYLLEDRGKNFVAYIFSADDYNEKIEKVLIMRSYKLLSMCIISLFTFFVFSVIVFYDLPKQLNISQVSKLKDIVYIILGDPFVLLFLSVINGFLAIWTFLSHRKVAAWISVEIVALDNLLSKRLHKESKGEE